MTQLYRLAKLLVCCWLLGGDEKQDIPSSNGILDRALELAKERHLLPAWAWEHLHFSDTRIGLQCLELPSILEWAQTAELTTFPNPSYQITKIKIDEDVARWLLEELDIPVADAAAWGRGLREAAVQATREFAEVQ